MFKVTQAHLLFVVLMCLTSASLRAQPQGQQIDLGQFRWKNRLLIFIAPPSEDQKLAQQRQFLVGEEELVDRDLKIIEIHSRSKAFFEGEQLDRASILAILEKLSASERVFEFFLLGKDGSVKLRSEEPVDSNTIFSLIDSMPMRRREMKEDSF